MEQELLEGVKSSKAETSRAQRFLEANSNEFDAETQKAIKARTMMFHDADLYFRTEFAAGATVILDSSNKKVIGLSNLDENKLPSMVYLALEKIRLAYGTHATETNPAAIDYHNTGTIPIPLMNGEIVIRVDDKPIVELPVARFFNNAGTGISNAIQGLMDAVELKAMRLIKPSSTITIELNTAKGLALAAGKHYLEVRLMGASTRKR